MGIHLVLALIIFFRIAYSTNVSPARRVFAQLADVAAISWYMAVFGEPAGWLLLLYIWVTLGWGFRFGARYLLSELGDERGRLRHRALRERLLARAHRRSASACCSA